MRPRSAGQGRPNRLLGLPGRPGAVHPVDRGRTPGEAVPAFAEVKPALGMRRRYSSSWT